MEKIKGLLNGGKVFSNSAEALQLYEKSRFGEKLKEKILYMPEEIVFLIDDKKLDLFDTNEKELGREEILRKFVRLNKRFMDSFLVFSDLRKKGFVVKSGLKFGSDFRVYEKGVKVGGGHSKWICFCVNEKEKLEMKDFSGKNRIAHSTKKRLLLGIVDSEGDVSYYETNWKKIV